MMRLIRFAVVFLVLLNLIGMSAKAQIKATTASGQRVLLYSDGTWKFASEVAASDSAIAKVDTATVKAPEVVVAKPKPVKPPRVYSLECSALIDTERDRNSDAYSSVSKPVMIMRNDTIPAFTVSLANTKRGPLSMNFQILGKPCIAEGNKMNLVMKDGSRYMLETDSKANCTGTFTLFFGNLFGKELPLQSMKQGEILAVRLYHAKGFVEGSFDDEAAKKILAALNCISK